MQFDLIVIGSGLGGYKAATIAAGLGAKVALIERDLPGGNCLNHGCIPKKTLLNVASLIGKANALVGRGLTEPINGDFKAAMAQKNAVVKGLRDNFSVGLKRFGVSVFYGEASFIGSHQVRIRHLMPQTDPLHATLDLEAARIIIATGSRPKELSICPTDGRMVANSEELLSCLDHVPRSVLCVGGGAIGVELGFMLHQFGAKVHIVEQGERLLHQARNMADRACGALERKLCHLGIEVSKALQVVSCRVGKDGVHVAFNRGDIARYDYVLVAVGRQPNTQGLGLEKIGVEVDADGFIPTSAYLETCVSGIYAVGDVKRSAMASPMTASVAQYDARVAAVNAMKGNGLRANYFKVPYMIHSALEMACVGFSEEQADCAGFSEEVARSSLRASGKAHACHDVDGYIEMVHDAETGQLLGGSIVGQEAGEQIHMLAAALFSRQGMRFFKDMVYGHPSWSEEMETAVDTVFPTFSTSGNNDFCPSIFAGD